jgi:hypothetical protein
MTAPELVAEAVYGLPELNRERLAGARLVANPGCYPTATQLALLPLVEAGVVDLDHLIADAKSGVSGAGRKAELHLGFSEASDNFAAYNVPGHRHWPEIRQGLAQAARREVGLVFTTHLLPLIRGIEVTAYARITREADFQALFEKRYGREPFVDVMPPGSHPDTRSVRAANLCRIAVHRPPQSAKGVRHACGVVGHRQPGEGGVGPGGAEHEPDVRSSGDGGADSGGGGALKRWAKTLRRRFGIATSRVEIHNALPWYWRWLGIAVLLGISYFSALWIYDAGRRFAGFDRSEVQVELSRVSRELDDARSELERLRAVANAADSRLSIERTAQQKLAQQIRTLEQDNARLREELGTFESMVTSEARSGNAPSIYSFQVVADVLPGEYRYRLLLVTPSARREREFNGRMELVVSLQEEGRNVMMSFPEQADAAAFRLAFKYFRRVEGTFRVNPKAKVESVQVRIYETGSSQPRATHSVAVGPKGA